MPSTHQSVSTVGGFGGGHDAGGVVVAALPLAGGPAAASKVSLAGTSIPALLLAFGQWVASFDPWRHAPSEPPISASPTKESETTRGQAAMGKSTAIRVEPAISAPVLVRLRRQPLAPTPLVEGALGRVGGAGR